MKVFKGKVVSVKMQKTAVVAVERFVKHSVYQKRLKLIKKYPVHDEIEVKAGQQVEFVASKPYSKTKRWRITRVIEPKIKKQTKGKKTKKS